MTLPLSSLVSPETITFDRLMDLRRNLTLVKQQKMRNLLQCLLIWSILDQCQSCYLNEQKKHCWSLLIISVLHQCSGSEDWMRQYRCMALSFTDSSTCATFCRQTKDLLPLHHLMSLRQSSKGAAKLLQVAWATDQMREGRRPPLNYLHQS